MILDHDLLKSYLTNVYNYTEDEVNELSFKDTIELIRDINIEISNKYNKATLNLNRGLTSTK